MDFADIFILGKAFFFEAIGVLFPQNPNAASRKKGGKSRHYELFRASLIINKNSWIIDVESDMIYLSTGMFFDLPSQNRKVNVDEKHKNEMDVVEVVLVVLPQLGQHGAEYRCE